MEIKLTTKSMSSLEKCFLDDRLEEKQETTHFTVFQNQRLCFQIGVCLQEAPHYKERIPVRISGELAKYARVRLVTSLPSAYPCIANHCDGNYIRREPGLYPDLLRPLHYQGCISLLVGQLRALWIDADLPQDFPAGTYTLTVTLGDSNTDGIAAEQTVTVRVLGLKLPPQRLIHTEWFYTDCIAEYYRVRAFSERHWRIIESFLRTAVQNGINMILTPVFTPELDTYIGGERLTAQLLDITVEKPGVYRFGFEQLERWIDLCRGIGVEYFEIPHFFTQWGAKHAPKFIATVNGRKKQIFGWKTDSCGEEYKTFLAQMLPALVAFLEKKGVASHTYFHISDEPHLSDLAQYLRCKELVEPHIKGYPIIDALSDYDFYESGALKKPVPGIKSIQPFLDRKVEGLWTYYCGAGGLNTTGRLLAMPLARTRILGVQLYLARIEGFLHWGYNFYNNQDSYERIDPFLYTDGEYFAPSGDTCLVYPGDGGEAWESLRLNAMREAMEDIRTLELCEALCGRSAVEGIIREVSGMDLTFTSYPTDAAFLLRLRERLIERIEANQPKV